MTDISENSESASEVEKSRGNRIRKIREEMLEISRPKFCAKHGIAKGSLRNWELGLGSGLSPGGAHQLAEAFKREGIKASADWLMHGNGFDPTKKKHTDGISAIPRESVSADTIERLLASFCQEDSCATYTTVENNGLTPYLNQGEYVLGLRYYNNRIADALNTLCIVHTTNGKVHLGYLRLSDGREYQLQTSLNDNPKNDKTLDILSAAPILAILCKPR